MVSSSDFNMAPAFSAISTCEVSDGGGWLDQYDRVVAAAALHMPGDILAAAARIGRDQRDRLAYAGTVLLVGLAGGTGSGKSSLLNALADEEVSPAGAFRPTTSRPLAWVPAALVSRLSGLFERFGITDIVPHSLEPAVAIIDLPDVDSIDGGHRRIVAGLLPILDLVVWVLDPEKYRDRVLHRDYLAPLAIHRERFCFVLNQVDRVDANEIPEVVEDLTRALATDGLEDPVIWVAAADPTSGPPIGVEQIWEGLVGWSGSGDERLLASELRRGLNLLAPHVRPLGLTARWDQIRHVAAALWASGRRPEASRELQSFLVELASEAPEIESQTDVDSLIGSPVGDETSVARHLDMTFGRYLRGQLRPRAITRALADELALSLSSS
jgi:hypothetical protein